jgi:type IV pilus assembly protein PilQ
MEFLAREQPKLSIVALPVHLTVTEDLMVRFLRLLLLFACLVVGIGTAILVAAPDSWLPAKRMAQWHPFSQLRPFAAHSRELVTSDHQAQEESSDRRSSSSDTSHESVRTTANPLTDADLAKPIVVTPSPPVQLQIEQIGDFLEKLQKFNGRPIPTYDAVLNAQRNPTVGVAPSPLDGGPAGPVGPARSPAEMDLPPPEERLKVLDEGDGKTSINMYGADIRQVLDMFSMQGQLNVLTGPSVTGPVFGTLTNVHLDEALDAVVRLAGFQALRFGDFILVGTPSELIEMQRLSETIVVRVYRPNYISAAELQTLVAPLLSDEGSASISNSSIAVSSPSEQGMAGGGNSAGGDSFAGNEVVVIRDLTSVLQQIDRIYDQLDVQPRQVSIEATILSVRLNDSNQFGVDFEMLLGRSDVRLVGNSPLPSLAAVGLTSGGLNFGFLDTDISTFISALESIGDTNVVASPRLMCVNKQLAEILIGSKLGYVSTTVTQTATTQAVEFLEVGTQLRFRPFISDDGNIRLEIHPELSTGSVRIVEGFTLPDKDVTQVTTNIICPNNKTIIIGGLIREDLSVTTTQIPLLGNLPLFGVLFRNQTESKERRELIVLLTPRIIDLSTAHSEATALGNAFLERHEINEDKMSIIGRQYHGKRFVRLAQAAFHAGDIDVARRYVNLSLQFNPQSIEAVRLRQEVNKAHRQSESIDLHLRSGLMPGTRPHIDYSQRGFPWRPEPVPFEDPPIIDDLGSPGSRSDISFPPYERFLPFNQTRSRSKEDSHSEDFR